MPTETVNPPITDALRRAIQESGSSYNELARLAHTDPGSISNFMLARRDLTVAVASRLCLVLGYGLTRVGPPLTAPLADPPKSNRNRPKSRRPPASAVKRGQGRRVDLEAKEEEGVPSEKVGRTTSQSGEGETAPSIGGPVREGRKRKKR